MNRFPWRSLIAGFILLLLLTGSGCSTAVPPTTTPAPSATLPADSSAAGRQSDWRPFHFQPGQEFTYAIRYQPAGQAEQSGTFVLNVTEAGAGKVKADWQGSLGSEHFAASTIAAPDQIAPNMLTGMVRNPAAAPVYFTLFHPWMGMGIWALALGSGNLEVGSKWSQTRSGHSYAFEVVEKRSYAGAEGYLLRSREDDHLQSEVCIAPQLPFALMARWEENGNTYYSELTAYRGPQAKSAGGQ